MDFFDYVNDKQTRTAPEPEAMPDGIEVNEGPENMSEEDVATLIRFALAYRVPA